MDYIDFVVHVFTEERREFYRLERLWHDAPHVEIAPPDPTPAQTAERSRMGQTGG
jgi:ribosome-associated protein